ncbi:hypothetical protein DRF65_26810 [Chryseobacterium pennae]|uniref:Uncharacterized protein n=1 Tax=Chryseobacterium pennae TaxID=2258962 RepID=A0A3D9C1B0_9FLAO|nr:MULTISPECIES: hypothetical protein [Chryseobacterium]MCS4304606.1 hypothetical protein [Chryseobacterium sp. BIGb0232]REC59312.1 hypothetical protein DRF65_26810 [Chryseobacterium pennae]ROS20734.1 hypothetical protein EDF65_1467 [Chryseobacterium nakagawai]
MKKLQIILIILFSIVLNAQTYDTIDFKNIMVNNHLLYSNFQSIRKNIDDTKTNAKVFTGKEMNIPFCEFKSEDIFYTVFSKNLVFSYNENLNDEIFITYVKPNKSFNLKLKTNGNSLILNTNTSVKTFKKYFKKSSYTLLNDKKGFKLIVKNGKQYANCNLIFKNNRFVEMYLEK